MQDLLRCWPNTMRPPIKHQGERHKSSAHDDPQTGYRHHCNMHQQHHQEGFEPRSVRVEQGV